METLVRRAALILLVIFPLFVMSALALPPDCVWSAYGCDYRAYLHDDGGATVFMDCGDFIYMYSGAGTTCPSGSGI